MPWFKKKEPANTVQEVPVLCRLWEEDGVFNGVAEHLPVAVFGKNYEEAHANLMEAILDHLEALKELHKLDATIAELRELAQQERFSAHDLERDVPYVRLSAAVHDSQILALT